ncbi:hypothetical protein [Methylobacterium sp. NEAU K]|uniref:hypothetical protein n=1 Tax=Methylobacterium sp. NEAU K TaxID=3064946 RepID=UPI0027340D93|nr:hypothetical protein [Methylobacterium sp. NEAU K]MDP4003329.1 hypothetical protein [Methylobacterium sp. NEAU K]
MPLDPFALVVAASFTAGCASIHALRHHADVVTLVLAALAYGLVATVGSVLVARDGMIMLPDHTGGHLVLPLAGGASPGAVPT